MSTTQSAQNASLAYLDQGSVRVLPSAKVDVRNAITSFLDMAGTATGQATFYNTKAEQLDAMEKIHTAVYSVNRGLYAAMLCLPGVTDDSMQRGVSRLLNEPYNWMRDEDTSMLSYEQENKAIAHMAQSLPPQRLLKMFGMFKAKKINNKRTRRLILQSVLNSDKLGFWAVKYRAKLKDALTHAWGKKVASAVLRFTSDPVLVGCEDRLVLSLCRRMPEVRQNILKYMHENVPPENLICALESVCFILGGKRQQWRQEVIRAFHTAHTDLSAGSVLPVEVLQGIRARYFKDTPAKAVFDIAKGAMTEGQKMQQKTAAERTGAEMDFDATKQEFIKLYVYALEKGCTAEIRAAMLQKAERIARTFPLHYPKVAVVVDASLSMFGIGEAKRRPMAITLAMRDILVKTGRESTVLYTGKDPDQFGMVEPSGDTSLASLVLRAMEEGADAVYMLTDGYENAPAGRVDEMIRAAREIGVTVPVYQITPVLAAEKVGIRKVSDLVAPMPVTRPEALGLSMVRAALEADLERGILSLLDTARPMLGPATKGA